MTENQSLIFPHLWKFHLEDYTHANEDRTNLIVRHFTLQVPSLTSVEFQKNGHWYWQNRVYMIVKQQYNFHRLEDVYFAGYRDPLSTLLCSLRMSFPEVKIDDGAVVGISTGVLLVGRFLRKLDLRCYRSDLGRVLTMLETRQRRIEKQVDEEFTAIKDVTLRVRYLSKEEYASLVTTLEELGIVVKLLG